MLKGYTMKKAVKATATKGTKTAKAAKGKKVVAKAKIAKTPKQPKAAKQKATPKTPEAIKPPASAKRAILLAKGSDGSQFVSGVHDAKTGRFWMTHDSVTGKPAERPALLPLDVKNVASNLRGTRYANSVYCVGRDPRMTLEVMSEAQAKKLASKSAPVIVRGEGLNAQLADAPAKYTAAIVNGVPGWLEFRKLTVNGVHRNVNHYAVTVA